MITLEWRIRTGLGELLCNKAGSASYVWTGVLQWSGASEVGASMGDARPLFKIVSGGVEGHWRADDGDS